VARLGDYTVICVGIMPLPDVPYPHHAPRSSAPRPAMAAAGVRFSHGARIQTSHSSSLVRITGIALQL
jgi:hypothetical protein